VRRAAGDALALFVDDDVGAARAIGCGVHLGQGDGDPAVIAAGFGGPIGWSTHDLAQVAAAPPQASYLGFGPVRATASKAGAGPVTGWAALADACARSRLPVVAIGGLCADDALLVCAAGARAMAVIGGWLPPSIARDAGLRDRDGDAALAAHTALSALCGAFRAARSFAEP